MRTSNFWFGFIVGIAVLWAWRRFGGMSLGKRGGNQQ